MVSSSRDDAWHVPQTLEQGVVDAAVAGDDEIAALHMIGRAIPAGNPAAGFLNDHDARGHVPGANLKREEPVEPAGSDVGQVEGGRPGAAEALGLLGEPAPGGKDGVVAADIGGEAD